MRNPTVFDDFRWDNSLLRKTMPKNNKNLKGLQFNNFFRYLTLSEFNLFYHIWNQHIVANPMVFFLNFYDSFRI